MLDIKFIRENKEVVKAGAGKKHIKVDIDALIALDDKRRALLEEVEALRGKQNKASGHGVDPKKDKALLDEMKALKGELQKKEGELKEVLKKWRALMLEVPNIPDISVPEGRDDSANVEVRKVGSIPQFSFPPKSHTDILKDLNCVDFERGVKIAGTRSYILKGDAVALSLALWQFTFDFFRKKNFEFMFVPSLVSREAFLGTGYLPGGENDLYKTEDESYLVGTSEVSVMASFMGEVLEKKDLPKKILAFSPCYRREAGTYGKDTKGLVRVHEFYKWEQVVLCEATHEESVKLHEEVTANSEELMKTLGIPYRVVLNAGGDLGLGQVKKYDIEAWVPSENKYRETHSASYFHDFQSRRLNIKYKDTDGKTRFVHSLNNTAIALPRLLVPILENFQDKDGRVVVPDVLRARLGKDVLGR